MTKVEVSITQKPSPDLGVFAGRCARQRHVSSGKIRGAARTHPSPCAIAPAHFPVSQISRPTKQLFFCEVFYRQYAIYTFGGK